MRLKLSIILLLLPLCLPSAAQAYDISSPYLPEIQSLTWSGLHFMDGTGSKSGSSAAQVNLKVRIHRNSLTYFQIYFTNYTHPKLGALDVPCADSIALYAGDAFHQLDSKILNLNSRIADGDWFIEQYQLSIQTNGIVRPLCDGDWILNNIELADVSSRTLSIRYEAGANYQSSYFWNQTGLDSKYLPCPKAVASSNQSQVNLTLCNQKNPSSEVAFKINKASGGNLPLPEVIDYASAVSQLKIQISTINSQLTSALDQLRQSQSETNSLKNKLAQICKSKPKPKGC